MRYHLPKSGGDDSSKAILAGAITSISNRGLNSLNPRKVEWKINYHYLQGVRDFHIVSFRTGRVDATWESDQGQLKFRYEDVLEQYNRQLGQYLSLNPKPKVAPLKKMDLGGLRKAAAAQVYLDHITGPLDLDRVHLNLCEGLLQFGTMGVGAFHDPSISLFNDTYMATIPPWQLIPIPTQPTRSEDVVGLIRHRWVPYMGLLAGSTGRLKWPPHSKPDGKMGVDSRLGVRWSSHGSRPPEVEGDPEDLDNAGIDGDSANREIGQVGPTDTIAHGIPYVLLIEVWLTDHRGRVDRRIVQVGEWIASDTDFSEDERKPVMPIGIARSDHAGGFYARPWVSKIIPFNSEAERMFANLFKNVQEFDQFGHMFLPANVGIKREHLMSTQKPMAHFFEQDYMGQEFKIHRVVPVNSGELPGKVAATAISMADRLGGNSPLYRGDMPGRAESAASLGVLHETAAISRKACVSSIGSSYTQAYRSILAHGGTSNLDSLQLTTVDHSIAGVTFEQDGTISLSSNPLPDPDEVRISIRSMEPRLLTQRKQELLEMLKAQQIDAIGFSWVNHIEELGFPLDDLAQILAREVCMYRNLVSFNDGETPRQVVTSQFDLHHIHERCILEFMQFDAFAAAGVAVQQVIEDRLDFHQQALGKYPEGMDRPEDNQGGQLPPISQNLPPNLQKAAQTLQASGQKAQLSTALKGAGVQLPTGQPSGGGP